MKVKKILQSLVKPLTRFWMIYSGLGILAFLPPVMFLLISLSWHMRDTPDWHYLGFLQGDQISYTAFAQAAFHRGSGLFYANPFDCDSAAPQVLTNGAYVGLGWLFRLTGGRIVLSWEIGRILFGFACYALIALVIANMIQRNYFRRFAFIAACFGGGAAWLFMLPQLGANGWLKAFQNAEKGYDWWCLNPFRQSLYPLELCYHALFFAVILCYIKRRVRLMLVLFFLLWWTHVITALLTTCTIGLALLWEIIRARLGKPTSSDRSSIYALAGLAGISAIWTWYYHLFLPSHASIASWVAQSLVFNFDFNLRYWLPAFGLLIIAFPIAILFGPLRHWLYGDRQGRLLVCWIIALLFWTHNNLILFQSIQPIHFARGYLYLVQLLLIAKAAELAWEKWPAGRIRARTGIFAALAAILLLLPDNALFIARVASERPAPELLSLPPDMRQTLSWVKEQAGSEVFSTIDQKLGMLILTFTPHRVVASEPVLTPDLSKKVRAEVKIRSTGDIAYARAFGIRYHIYRKGRDYMIPLWVHSAHFRLLFENHTYLVGEMIE